MHVNATPRLSSLLRNEDERHLASCWWIQPDRRLPFWGRPFADSTCQQILPIIIWRNDAEPLLCIIWQHEFAVVLEDDVR
jgi:hypothetical protein